MRRRTFLAGAVGLGASAAAPTLSWAVAAPTDRRLVLVVLRGALDGLAAVPVPGDPSYRGARGEAAVDGAIPLDGTFGLHPGLAPLKARWDAGELAIVHATSGPYRDRSHFDGQNTLENGTDRPFGAPTGWLSRALDAMGARSPALAVGRTLPLVLTGPAPASSGDPARAPQVDADVLVRLEALYRGDPVLAPALAQGLAMEAHLAAHRAAGRPDAEVLGRVLAAQDGPRVAVIELGGWDTHVRQEPTLAARLPDLAAAVDGLHAGLGGVWADTAVAVVTEFGRTVHTNGTGGTDHGTGGVAFLVGGAVAGGRVIADWPGLRDADLLDGRDLRPTTDLRAVLGGVVRDHLGVMDTARVFPGAPAPLDGLIRAPQPG